MEFVKTQLGAHRSGIHKITVQGIEGFGVKEIGTIGRRKDNSGKVRGNAIEGVNTKSVSALEKSSTAKTYLNGKSPTKMAGTGKTLKGTKTC